MNAIKNKRKEMSAIMWNSDNQQSDYILQLENHSATVLRTRRQYACSVALTG